MGSASNGPSGENEVNPDRLDSTMILTYAYANLPRLTDSVSFGCTPSTLLIPRF